MEMGLQSFQGLEIFFIQRQEQIQVHLNGQWQEQIKEHRNWLSLNFNLEQAIPTSPEY